MKEVKSRLFLSSPKTQKPKNEGYYETLKRALRPNMQYNNSADMSIEDLESQKKFRDLLEKVKRGLDDDTRRFREARYVDSPSQGKTRGGNAPRQLAPSFAIVDDYRKECYILREKFEKLSKSHNSLNAEHSKMKRAMEIRQDTFIRREERMKRKEKELRKKLLEATTFHRSADSGGEDEHAKLRASLVEKKRKIQKGVLKLQGDAVALLTKREEEYKNQLREMERQYKISLEEERNKNFSDERDFIEKTRLLKKMLEEFRKKSEDLDKRNQKLEEENLKLRISYRSQQDNDTKWAKLNAKYKQENQKLRGIIEENALRFSTKVREIEGLRNHMRKLQSGLNSLSALENRQLEVDTASVTKLKRQMDMERKNFKILKKTYIDTLSERTELEIFIKQCISDIVENLKKVRNSAHKPGSDMVELNEVHRNKVIELLLSKQKVLELLYEKSFPYKPSKKVVYTEVQET